jgi:type I site-specific restriction-modification system R (restriction) subunit
LIWHGWELKKIHDLKDLLAFCVDFERGIIWHTQGSGKSFTMVFLVRTMRTLPDLKSFKVVTCRLWGKN